MWTRKKGRDALAPTPTVIDCIMIKITRPRHIKSRGFERGTIAPLTDFSERHHLLASASADTNIFTMKSALFLLLASISTLVVASRVNVHDCRQNMTCDPNGWVQNPVGCATFTSAHNCARPCEDYAYFRVLTPRSPR